MKDLVKLGGGGGGKLFRKKKKKKRKHIGVKQAEN